MVKYYGITIWYHGRMLYQTHFQHKTLQSDHNELLRLKRQCSICLQCLVWVCSLYMRHHLSFQMLNFTFWSPNNSGEFELIQRAERSHHESSHEDLRENQTLPSRSSWEGHKGLSEFGHHWVISYSFYFIFIYLFHFKDSLLALVQQNEEKRINIRWVIEENWIFNTWLLWNTQVWIWIELDTGSLNASELKCQHNEQKQKRLGCLLNVSKHSGKLIVLPPWSML